MTSDEIREQFLAFFEQRDHQRLASASLVPATYDPSVLLTTAGMHPLKPYFLGQEHPPHSRLASCQKCFRTVDVERVGNTARHLTFFEMLGNFSIGDYFKVGAIEFAWELSLEVFGFDAERIWVTVFEGDEELGLGADEDAIEAWLTVGVPRERIVGCPRSENFWQAGPVGPCGPCSELYLDRGEGFGSSDERPGGEGERFLEYWNLVFMQYNQQTPGALTPLPAQSIDTGLGLNRLAAILQDTPSVFETDQFLPLIELGESLSGRRYGTDAATDRALRILADHARAMTFLIADGVVPSNEDRGYVLRRLMRRAIQQGRRVLELEPGFLSRYGGVVRELMGSAYPELAEQREATDSWLAAEEESFSRTLEAGIDVLRELIERGRETGTVPAADAFLLHDTHGFPFELTQELIAEAGLAVDAGEFDVLMDAQRVRSRAADAVGDELGADVRPAASVFAAGAGFTTRFTGYEAVEQATTVGALERHDGQVLVKLAESPFYAAGGGQVSDRGVIECEAGDCRVQVAEVLRIGDDQALVAVAEDGQLEAGERVVARVDRAARHATECNHTATHLLHAALRARLGTHVRQAGSYVGPDKLRFDFSHAGALSATELRDVEDQVNAWIADNLPLHPIQTTLDEARALGAMALFGEKYGDVVRMVEVGDGAVSRELCGGTHVRSTAEIGVMRILMEGSSAANVRRIEAVTGPAAVALLRSHDDELGRVSAALRTAPEQASAVAEARGRELAELRRVQRAEQSGAAEADVEELAGRVRDEAGALVLAEAVVAADEKDLLTLLDRLKARVGDAAIVLGAPGEGRVMFVASVAPALVAQGIKAGAIVKAAAEVTGGGGGGRDTMARAGGRDPEKLEQGLAAARAAIATMFKESG